MASTLTATARVPVSPLSYENKDKVTAKELVVDYNNNLLYISNADGELVSVASIVIDQIEQEPDALKDIITNINITLENGNIVTIENGIVQNTSDIESLKEALGLSTGDTVSINVSSITGTLPIASGGTGATTAAGALTALGAAASSHGTHVTYSTTVPVVASTANVGTATTVSRSDHVHPAQTTVSGNAGTATKLTTARTITITGAASGNVSFDGSANVSMTLSSLSASSINGTVAITNGGTGANTAAGALSALGAASTITYTATVAGSSWTYSSSGGYYSKSVSVTGILSTDNPIVDVVLSTTYETAMTELEEYNKIYKVVTGTGTITIYASEATTSSISLQLKCIR